MQKGVVTLSGHVPEYVQRFTATRCAQRVRGVKACLDFVRLPNFKKRADDQIADRAVSILNWTLHDLVDIKVAVEGGWVTLSDWLSGGSRSGMRSAPSGCWRGNGRDNAIVVRPHADPESIRAAIHRALRRTAELEAAGIGVAVAGAAVTLTGTVNSWQERRAAEEAALTVPGVDEVHDLLVLA